MFGIRSKLFGTRFCISHSPTTTYNVGILKLKTENTHHWHHHPKCQHWKLRAVDLLLLWQLVISHSNDWSEHTPHSLTQSIHHHHHHNVLSKNQIPLTGGSWDALISWKLFINLCALGKRCWRCHLIDEPKIIPRDWFLSSGDEMLWDLTRMRFLNYYLWYMVLYCFPSLPIQFQIDIEVALTSIFAWNMKGKNQSRSR